MTPITDAMVEAAFAAYHDVYEAQVNSGASVWSDKRLAAICAALEAGCATLLERVAHLELVMRECCDAIRDSDEFSALRMLEAALAEGRKSDPDDDGEGA
jgi:hypothetical protein